MKIVRIDNFDREIIPDKLVAENITSAAYAEVMCKALCAKYSSEQGSDYFVVRPDDYKLREFKE